jgi:hypothetical protein
VRPSKKKSAKAALDAFGKYLIQNVRDLTIGDIQRMIEEPSSLRGKPKTSAALAKLSDADKESLNYLAIDIVDSVLHNLLFGFEQAENIKISVETEAGPIDDLKAASDGLAGELYDRDGWINKFSKYEGSVPRLHSGLGGTAD